MAIKIIFANNKGGVGKTTSAINLSGFLASKGKRVLTIDLDPQSNLTVGLGINILSPYSGLSEVLKNQCDIESATIQVSSCLHVLPAKPDLEETANELDRNRLRKYELLKFKLNSVKEYEFVIMDTAPAAKSFLSLNGLAVADYIIIPTQLEHFSIVGLKHVIDVIAEVREQYLNPDIRTLGLLPTFYQNTNNCKYHLQLLQDKFGPLLMQTKIRKNVALSESTRKGKPIFKKGSNGYEDYENFTNEFLQRLGL